MKFLPYFLDPEEANYYDVLLQKRPKGVPDPHFGFAYNYAAS